MIICVPPVSVKCPPCRVPASNAGQMPQEPDEWYLVSEANISELILKLNANSGVQHGPGPIV